jgi:hypothetical protein
MAGNITGLHVFTADVGPEALSLLDGNFSPLATTINTLATFANYYADTGAVNALVVTTVGSQVFALAAGVFLDVAVANTTTNTTPTLNVNATGAKTIVNSDGSAVLAGAMVANGIYRFGYDGANYRLQNPSAMKFSSLTVGPPVSGVGLTITGAAGSYAALINSASSGTENGLQIRAGAAIGDAAFTITNQAFTSTFFQIFGDASGGLGQVSANHNLSWNAAGNFSISAPASGTAFTIAGGGISVTGTSALAALTATTGVFTGLVQAQLGLTVTGAAFTSRGISDSATTNLLTLTAGGAIQGFGPVAAGLVDMTPDTSTYTGTLTGCTTSPTTSVRWVRNGNQVTITLGALTATSNANTMTITGMPAGIRPTGNQGCALPSSAMENNGVVDGVSYDVAVFPSGVLTFARSGNTTGFTASNTKGVVGTITFTYELI